MSDIFQLNCRLSDEYNLPFSLFYQDTGFMFTLKKSDLESAGRELPRGFINVITKKGKFLFSSMELVSPNLSRLIAFDFRREQKKLNARMKDALDETLILSDKYA